jgi:hypothetical protein
LGPLQASLELDGVARTLLAALAAGQGMRCDTFLPLMDDVTYSKAGSSCLEAIRYKADGAMLGCEQHEDKGLLSLIWCPEGGALKARP